MLCSGCYGEGGHRLFKAEWRQLCGLLLDGPGDRSCHERSNKRLHFAIIGVRLKRSHDRPFARFCQLKFDGSLCGGDRESGYRGFRKRKDLLLGAFLFLFPLLGGKFYKVEVAAQPCQHDEHE